jgi:hypothetical protein
LARVRSRQPSTWPEYARVIHAAETKDDFSVNIRAQTETVAFLAKGYFNLPAEFQASIRERLCPLLPRVKVAEVPEACLEALFALTRRPNPEEEISRALKMFDYYLKDFEPEPGDDLYPTEGWIGDYIKWVRCTSARLHGPRRRHAEDEQLRRVPWQTRYWEVHRS